MSQIPANSTPAELQGTSAQASTLSERLRRWTMAFVGVICVCLAALGAVLPGLPTTIFLILASYLFTRSCPMLERRLLRNRLFARSMAYVDGDVRLTQAQRWRISGAIAASVTLSSVVVTVAGGMTVARLALIVSIGLVGVLTVFLWRRSAPAAAATGDSMSSAS